LTAPAVDDKRVREAAKDWVRAAWRRLLEDDVLPVPPWRRFLSVGSDYFGPQDADAYAALESALTERFARFNEDRPLGEREFPGMYVHSLLQLCIARAAEMGDSAALTDQLLDEAIAELITSLDRAEEEVFCARVIAHLGTIDGQPLTIGEVKIEPVVVKHSNYQAQTAAAFNRIAWGAGQFVLNENLLDFDDTVAVISTAGSRGPRDNAFGPRSAKLEQVVMTARLLWGSTCDSTAEVRGGVGPIRSQSLHFEQLGVIPAGRILGFRQVQRPVLLSADDGARIAGLKPLLDLAFTGDEDKLFTSIRSAYYRYVVSFRGEAWFDEIVDLVTALEGTFGGQSTSDVCLRLRVRSAALLACAGDPAGDISRDIKVFYDLRSRVLHGGVLSEKDLRKKVSSISTISDASMLGLAVDRAVDRLRDLVRRAILCRLALASGEDPIWPLADDQGVDEALSDDDMRVEWRNAWRAILATFDAEFAADPAPPLMDMFEVHAKKEADQPK
jgi:hypothetical protein